MNTSQSEAGLCSRCGAELADDGLCPACLLAAGTQAEPPRSPRELPNATQLADRFPHYDIGELVGQGGMGLVYRARHRTLDRSVALKLLAPEIAARPGFADRFAREARVLASLTHPNIVAVYESGQAGPWFYFAMEFVEGVSLRDMLRAKSVDASAALGIIGQMCDALHFAHGQGVVHRDIKPENVLVDRAGRIKILDFGLSKMIDAAPGQTLTRSDQIMGTPHYMAPEQWEKPSTVDHRADIYALGVVFYELLTGELPLGRFEPPSHKVRIDVRLDDVVLRTLAKEPARRYQHASEVKTDVEHVHATPQARTAAEHSGKGRGRSRRIAPSSFDRSLAKLGLLDLKRGAPAPAKDEPAVRITVEEQRRQRHELPFVFILIILLGVLSVILTFAFALQVLTF